MEDMYKKTNLGLPPWQRKPTGVNPFATMAPSNLPLPSSASYQVWQKPYFMNHGSANNGGTKTYLKPSDGNIAPVSLDDKNELTQNPSEPSDKNPISDGVVDTADEPVTDVQIQWGRKLDPNMDPKKLKRIVSNRLSAQKSRLKKLQYITDMERHTKSLETEIAVLSPQLAFHLNQQKLLKMENILLNQRITTCADDLILIEAQIEENNAEVNRLRQLYMTQQQQMQGQTTMSCWANLGIDQSGLEQMVYMNSNQGGKEEILNFNSLNLNPLNGFM